MENNNGKFGINICTYQCNWSNFWASGIKRKIIPITSAAKADNKTAAEDISLAFLIIWSIFPSEALSPSRSIAVLNSSETKTNPIANITKPHSKAERPRYIPRAITRHRATIWILKFLSDFSVIQIPLKAYAKLFNNEFVAYGLELLLVRWNIYCDLLLRLYVM